MVIRSVAEFNSLSLAEFVRGTIVSRVLVMVWCQRGAVDGGLPGKGEGLGGVWTAEF